MAYLIPAGAIITMIGLVLLMVCIVRIAKARKAGLSDDDLRAVMQATVPLNMGALFLSAIGLMMVVAGILLS